MNMTRTGFSNWRLIRCYWLEARFEFLRLLRTPAFVLPTLLFPSMFYLLFGVALNGSDAGNTPMSRYMLATYGTFGVMGVALFGFGITIAVERERGFLALKRALPMPPGALLFAKTVMAMTFAAIISLMLAAIAAFLAGVSLAPWQWIMLFVVNILGVIPFAAIGLLIGTCVSGQAAPAVVNLIYLPMSFLSGLWIPLPMLPDYISGIAPVWPSYHLGRVALAVVGTHGDGVMVHIGILAAVSVACFLLAARRLTHLDQIGSG